MIDLSLIGKKYGPIVHEHSWKDVVLYALGIGAGTQELSFIYERAPGGLKVFPTFGAVMGYSLFVESAKDLQADFSRFIHGEETITMHGAIPTGGKTLIEGSISNVYDKGTGALIIWKKRISTELNELLCEVESGIFYVGEGGFGGDRGPKTRGIEPPEDREPTFSTAMTIPENQAALYRLSGDLNPLHVDPAFAEKGGYERPILHGMCTFGYAQRAILLNTCLENVDGFKQFKARFAGVVYPGDTLVTQGWMTEGGSYLIRAHTTRGTVLSHAAATIA
jgi:acyl dehydratase